MCVGNFDDGDGCDCAPIVELLDLTFVQGMPASKVPWLHDIARAALEGTLDAARLRDLELAQAIKELKRIEGIGEFSADLILIRGVGSPDVFPGNGPRVHRAMAERYGLRDPRVQDLAEIAEIAEIHDAVRDIADPRVLDRVAQLGA